MWSSSKNVSPYTSEICHNLIVIKGKQSVETRNRLSSDHHQEKSGPYILKIDLHLIFTRSSSDLSHALVCSGSMMYQTMGSSALWLLGTGLQRVLICFLCFVLLFVWVKKAVKSQSILTDIHTDTLSNIYIKTEFKARHINIRSLLCSRLSGCNN